MSALDLLFLSQVLASRKGIRNQLKGLLWRGRSGSASTLANSTANAPPVPDSSQRSAPAAGQAYSTGSIEFQMRMLADVAFLIQDYELAGSTLRLLAADFKSDRAWKHYAGAQVSRMLA